MDKIVDIPLTFVQLRKIYLLYNNNINKTKNKRPDVTINEIKSWLKRNEYKLESIKVYNVTAKKSMRYYKIVK